LSVLSESVSAIYVGLQLEQASASKSTKGKVSGMRAADPVEASCLIISGEGFVVKLNRELMSIG